MDIARILTEKFPGAQWTLNGDDYAGLTWISTDRPKPTKAELEALWPDVQRGPFRDRLRQKFLELMAIHEADLTDEQSAQVEEAAVVVERVHAQPYPDAVKKKKIRGVIKRINIPGKESVKTELLNFVETEAPE